MSGKRVFIYLALLSIITALLGASGCDNTVTGSGEIATWDMAYTDFNRLEISSTFDVTINRADSYLVRITIDKALYEYLKIDQRGDTLRIGLEPNNAYIGTKQQAIVGLPDLHRLKLSDASNAVVTGFSVSHSMDFELNDASRLELGPMIAGNCAFTLSDASRVSGSIEMDDGNFRLNDSSSLELEGSADDIKIDAASSSHVILPDFAVVTADVELSTSSSAVVNVSDRMDVHLSSSSELEYIGNPRLGKLDMSGDSTLNQRQ
jgi:hypothetical protein